MRPQQPQPLAGVRCIELCWVWAGPLIGQILADLGAEVIKVEWTSRFDLYRTRGVERQRGLIPEEVRRESSFSFHSLNRNKSGFTLDLKHEQGVDILKRLVARSDLLIENFTAGTLERLGIGADALLAVNPQLVVVSLSGPGRGSSVDKLRSYGLLLSALGGAEALIEDEGEFVGSPTFVLSDPNAAVFGVLAALGGLNAARDTGSGCVVDGSQIEAAATLAGLPPPDAPCLRHQFVHAEDGRAVAVSIPPEDGEDATALPECEGQTLDSIRTWCAASGGSAAPVYDLEETNEAPEFADCPGVLRATHPFTGNEDIVAPPWRVEGVRPPLRKPAPVLGESNDYVLRHVLGLSTDEIDRLIEQRVV